MPPDAHDVTMGSVPGFSLDLNGKEIGLPCQAAHAASGSGNPAPIRYALPIIYVGQFIDPTNSDNLAKFITAKGNPVAPSVAVEAFGTPTHSFTGSAADIVNSGAEVAPPVISTNRRRLSPPNRVVLGLLGARSDFYERKVPQLRRVRGKGGIFRRPTSPTAATAAPSPGPGPLPTPRRGP